MNLGFWNFYNAYNGNRMFMDPTSTTAGDDLAYGAFHLGQRLRGLGHQVATLDMDKLENFDAVIFTDSPNVFFKQPGYRYYRRLRRMPGKKLYLWLAENEANRPDNYWRWNQRAFDKVFTWNPTLVDNKKVFQMWHVVKIPGPFSINVAEKTKFCLTISSQKYLSHPKNLYAERVAIIRWFEREHPDQFDLYGGRWDRRYFTGGLSRLNLFVQAVYSRFPKRFHVRLFPSHRGTIPNKNAVMRQYKFAVVYENAVFPGYVSEKIFDAFFAGCVPIYLGAPDVTDSIPAETFVDRRKFRNHEELYQFLTSMSEKDYLGYIRAIEDFVRGDRIQVFGAENMVRIYLKEIVGPDAAKR
jgi:alpha(1,3/1,4) fucosyltransferase